MEIQKALSAFLGFHTDYSRPYTVSRYRSTLRRFVAWLESKGVSDTDQLEVQHLRDWLSHLRSLSPQRMLTRTGPRLDGATVHHYCLLAKIFVRWLEREEIITELISPRFQVPKLPEKAPKVLDPLEVQQILAACAEVHGRRPWAAEALESRNRAIVTTLIDTGLRRSELAGLRLGDVDYEQPLLYVTRKGGGRQAVPISSEAMEVLDGYLVEYRPKLARLVVAKKSDAVFLSGIGTPLGPDGISRLFVRLSKVTGIDITAHGCRRYMATTQIAMGRDSRHVQKQLGHRSSRTTDKYVFLTTEHIAVSHEQYSPLRVVRNARPKRGSRRYWDVDD